MATWKQVILKDPITGEYLAPMGGNFSGGDADSLGGKPASDYVTNDNLDEALNQKLTGYTTDQELQEALSGIATKAFEPYENETPPATLEIGKGIITTNNQLYVGDRSNKLIKISTSLNQYNTIISGEITLGNIVTMGGYFWRVSHIDESANEFYLTLNAIWGEMQFGSSILYAESNLVAYCSKFMNTMPANVINLLKEKTVEGVTAKVFIATRSQMNGDFAWFNSYESRLVYDSNSETKGYWTSSSSATGYMFSVGTDGGFGSTSIKTEMGFRPSVCLAL